MSIVHSRSFLLGSITLIAGLLMVGCSGRKAAEPGASAAAAPSPEGKKFVLSVEPEKAQDVKLVREQAKDNDEVVIVGRIGGEEKPFVDGAAAFSIVDRSLVPCNERPGDNCATPWDYCCDLPDLPERIATIKFVDAQGNPLSVSAKELLGIKELQTVVVRGQAKRTGNNLVVLANGIYVKK